ncbi:hypothetical protein BH20ACI4_BH20ACI4_16540 [soil metagenome]
MNFKFQISNFKFFQFCFVQFVLVISCIFYFGCSLPSLENPECNEARETVKEFYSKHFGNGLKPSLANLKKSEVFLTARLFQELKNQNEPAKDYFTQTDDYPKAFRVGGCDAVEQNKTVFEILLFWKDDTRNEQREIKVESVKENGKWLIDKVENKK